MTELKLYPISGCCHCPAFGGCQYTWDTCPLDTDGEIPGWLREKIKEQIDDYDMSIAIPRLLEAQRQYIKAQRIVLDWVLSLKKEDEE